MPNVLIRNVPPDDLERIRAAAAARGTSVQNYLRGTVQAEAAYLRRQDTLARIGGRLRKKELVPEKVRQAVLDAVDEANDDRADELPER